MITKLLFDLILPVFWTLSWIFGGFWIAQFVFNLRRNEQLVVGISLGLILQIWLAAIVNRFIPGLLADSIAAGMILGIGGLLAYQHKTINLKQILFSPQWIIIFLLTLLFTNLQRGLGLEDDLTALSALSQTAAGVLSPDSALGLSSSLALFFPAELQRLANLFPWNALNLARGLMITLSILLAATWTRRITLNLYAGWAAGITAAFSMGTGWLVLLASSPIQNSKPIQFFPPALQSSYPLPESFTNTIFQPLSATFSANDLLGWILIGCLLLTFTRWRQPITAGLLSSLLIASILLSVYSLPYMLFVCGLLFLGLIFKKRLRHPPAHLGKWLLVFGSALLLACLAQKPQQFAAEFGVITSSWTQSPVLFSTNFWTVLIQVLPFLLAFFLAAAWAVKALRANRWIEGLLMLSAGIAFIFIFIQPESRVHSQPVYLAFIVFNLYAPGLVWNWACQRGEVHKILAASLALITIFGGVFIFSILLTNLSRNELPPGISTLDAQVFKDHWGKLKPPERIFDSNPQRGEAVLGVPIAIQSQGLPSDLQSMRRLGYDILYMDEIFWNGLDSQSQDSYRNSCVKILKEYTAKRGDSFRRLINISACQ